MAHPIRLVIADDQPVILYALQQLFAAQDRFTILACCTDGESVLQSACLHRPDVLIFEIKLPGMDGFKVLRQLRQEGVTTPAIAYTAEPVDENHIIALWRLNVRGVVLKSMAPDFLVKSVQVVHEGGEWLEQGLLSRTFKKLLCAPPPRHRC